ncbi:MAG: hypothetical protein K5985_00415 [Lachnospiraceae bacterium]|nr:hypothetical protein [Lachnospiraceae bacterium]
MGDNPLQEKRQAFQNDFMTMNESAVGQEVYEATFQDQSQAENLLASGGGEELGPLEQELRSLSVINEIRALREKLLSSEEEGGTPMKLMERVESLEAIYANIRVADRNAAEAMALSKDTRLYIFFDLCHQFKPCRRF